MYIGKFTANHFNTIYNAYNAPSNPVTKAFAHSRYSLSSKQSVQTDTVELSSHALQKDMRNKLRNLENNPLRKTYEFAQEVTNALSGTKELLEQAKHIAELSQKEGVTTEELEKYQQQVEEIFHKLRHNKHHGTLKMFSVLRYSHGLENVGKGSAVPEIVQGENNGANFDFHELFQKTMEKYKDVFQQNAIEVEKLNSLMKEGKLSAGVAEVDLINHGKEAIGKINDAINFISSELDAWTQATEKLGKVFLESLKDSNSDVETTTVSATEQLKELKQSILQNFSQALFAQSYISPERAQDLLYAK